MCNKFNFRSLVTLSAVVTLAGCAFGNPMGGGDPEAVSRAVTTASACAAPLGRAEVISAEVAGMPVGMSMMSISGFGPGSDPVQAAATVAEHSGCFSVTANDASLA